MAFDIFLKLTNSANVLIKGESAVKGHENEIEVQSFSWGESHDGGVTDPQEMAFVTPVSRFRLAAVDWTVTFPVPSRPAPLAVTVPPVMVVPPA